MSFATMTSRWQDGALHYYDPAGNLVNIVGPNGFFTHFVGGYAPLNFTGENNGTATDGDEAGGSLLLTTGATSENTNFLASNRCFTCTKGLVAVARLKFASAANVAWNMVFTDATSESALLPLNYATTTLTNTATNAAGIFFDTDGTTDNIYAAASDNTVDSSLITVCAAASVDANYHTYKIKFDASGYMSVWYDNVLVGTADSPADLTEVYCAMIAVSTRTGSAKTLEIDYFGAWQATL
jgi:hypothetical protein